MLLLTFDTEQEKEEFSILYEKYASFMLRVARQLLQDPADAEDAVHDAFLYIADNLDKINISDQVKTKAYLAIITRHKAIDLLRRTAKEVPLEDYAAVLMSDLKWEEKQDLAKALLKLSPEARNILLLHYYYNYSYHEIAVFLGQSYRSVTGKASRAKKKLADIITDGDSHG